MYYEYLRCNKHNKVKHQEIIFNVSKRTELGFFFKSCKKTESYRIKALRNCFMSEEFKDKI